MSRRSGYVVRTVSGKEGVVYHDEPMVNGKRQVHVMGAGEDNLLCDEDSLSVIGFLD